MTIANGMPRIKPSSSLATRRIQKPAYVGWGPWYCGAAYCSGRLGGASRPRASMAEAGTSFPAWGGGGGGFCMPETSSCCCRFAEIALRGIITTPLHPEAQPCN